MNLFHRIRELFRPKPIGALSPDSTRAERGVFGEETAARFCREELGYRQLARNWRYKRDELDYL